MKSGYPSASGFTLIELMVTLAIAAVLLALAGPSFRNTLLDNQRAGRVNEFMADLAHARAQAVSLRRDVILCRTNAPYAATPACGGGAGYEEGWIVFIDRDGSNALEAADATEDVHPPAGVGAEDAVLRRHSALIAPGEVSLPANQKFTLRGGGNTVNRVEFSATGMALPTAGTLAACDERGYTKGRAIVVATSGRVRAGAVASGGCP